MKLTVRIIHLSYSHRHAQHNGYKPEGPTNQKAKRSTVPNTSTVQDRSRKELTNIQQRSEFNIANFTGLEKNCLMSARNCTYLERPRCSLLPFEQCQGVSSSKNESSYEHRVHHLRTTTYTVPDFFFEKQDWFHYFPLERITFSVLHLIFQERPFLKRNARQRKHHDIVCAN
jgi:hypothetical protein